MLCYILYSVLRPEQLVYFHVQSYFLPSIIVRYYVNRTNVGKSINIMHDIGCQLILHFYQQAECIANSIHTFIFPARH